MFIKDDIYRKLFGVNTDALFAAGNVLEFHLAVYKSVKCVVRTDTDIHTGMNVRSALSDNDITGDNRLSVRLFDSKALGFAVTTVLCRTDALFVSEEL